MEFVLLYSTLPERRTARVVINLDLVPNSKKIKKYLPNFNLSTSIISTANREVSAPGVFFSTATPTRHILC